MFLQHCEGSSLICSGELIGILSSEPSCETNNQPAVFQDLMISAKWLKENGISDIQVSSAIIIRSANLLYFLLAFYMLV